MSAALEPPAATDDDGGQGDEVLEPSSFFALVERWKLLVFAPLLVGCAGLALSYLVPPTFTARTSFLPPQQQSSAAAALASLGALASIAGGGAGLRTPADQYVALMQSRNVGDRLIDQFRLLEVYEVELRADARRELDRNVRFAVGKKDGLISIEVDDHSPQRAADIANQHVQELRRVTGELALTEAQQRRLFFEGQLALARDRLTAAQKALQGSGIGAGALKAEPKAAAEGYGRLRAEATAAEVRLEALRRSLTDNAPEVQQQLAVLSALRTQVARSEASTPSTGGPDYVGHYREFKYQETLFELLARQYELARVDESREGALIQVVDAASAPERKSRPQRALIGVATTIATFALLASWVALRRHWRRLVAETRGTRRRPPALDVPAGS